MITNKIKSLLASKYKLLVNFFTKTNDSLITIIPHGGCEIDGYNFINYKSDSALTFLHYLLEKYGDKFEYQVCTGNNERSFLQKEVARLYPKMKIRMIQHPLIKNDNSSEPFYKSVARSKYIFTSQALPLNYTTKKQRFFYLGYYACNLKNDFIDMYLNSKSKYNHTYTKFFTPSLLFSQLNSIVYSSPLKKFEITGLTRNDNLLSKYECHQLDKLIDESVDYPVKNVFLYTPTHRDYEWNGGEIRYIMGFPLDNNLIEKFLEQNNAVIIIKLHSHQNADVISKDIPKGILLHKSSHYFGLTELFQKANFLISDYTSAYYDYLVLDRPVLFNFYDYEKYQTTRGFSFDPITSLWAGEKFVNQESMIGKMKKVMKEDTYKSQRKFVRDLIFKYIDTKACERVYNRVFNDKETYR